MVSQGQTLRSEKSEFEKAAPFLQLIALLGIPAAGWVGLVFLLQIPRMLYGQTTLLWLAC